MTTITFNRNLRIIIDFILLNLVVFICSPYAAAQAQETPSVRRALLIGIDKYRAVPQLYGAENDINLVRQVLETKFGFSENNMQILLNAAATRKSILKAMREFVENVGPTDVAYIHFSGHGSQVKDLDGDETDDQLDETIVPQDGRTEGIPDITDDELEEILSHLKSNNTVIVLDSCHSGTGTRSVVPNVKVRARSIPRDMRVNLYKARPKVAARGLVVRAGLQKVFNRYTLFTGAAAHEEALDGPIDEQYHGIFTYALFKSLQSLPKASSVSEIYAATKQELRRVQDQLARDRMPEPQLEGGQERLEQPLFAGSEIADRKIGEFQNKPSRRAWIEARLLENDAVLLINGRSLGALPGSVWGIYSFHEQESDSERPKAIAKVVEVRESDALARLESLGEVIPDKSRAVLLVPSPQETHMPIRLGDIPANTREWLKSAIREKFHDVVFVDEGQFARFIIAAEAEQFHVYGADGINKLLTFGFSGDTDAVRPLVQRLIQTRNGINLLALENPNPGIRLSVRAAQTGGRAITVSQDTMEVPRYRIRRSSEPRTSKNSLQLDIRSDTNAYITVIDVDAEGNVNLLFPNTYQQPDFYPDGFIRAGTPFFVPDSLQSGNRAGFHWDIADPPGVDTIRVFGTPDRQLAERIRRALQPPSRKDAKDNIIVGQPLTQLQINSLRQELYGSITRGSITVSGNLPNWSAEALKLVIEK